MNIRLQLAMQHARIATAEAASNMMREPRFELGRLLGRQILSLAEPRRNTAAGAESPSVTQRHPGNSVSRATSGATSRRGRGRWIRCGRCVNGIVSVYSWGDFEGPG